MSTVRRPRVLKIIWWSTMVYWTGKLTGVLVAETTIASTVGRYEFTAISDQWWRAVKTRAWNTVLMAAVAYRIWTNTLTITQAAYLPQSSCYDTLCEDVWCVYACVYYAIAWFDRVSEVIALAVAVTWRRWSTVDCLNAAAADIECNLIEAEDDKKCISWHAYLTVVFPIVQFTVAANAISSVRTDWLHITADTVAAVASCAPIAAHGTAVALLIVANNSMQSINRRLIHLLLSRRHKTTSKSLHHRCSINPYMESDNDQWRRQRLVTVVRLANKYWRTSELVTGGPGVCNAYGVDLMVAVLLAAMRVTYVAISVFHRLTDDTESEENNRTSISLAATVQLIAWFGQFAYLTYICDELTTQVIIYIIIKIVNWLYTIKIESIFYNIHYPLLCSGLHGFSWHI